MSLMAGPARGEGRLAVMALMVPDCNGEVCFYSDPTADPDDPDCCKCFTEARRRRGAEPGRCYDNPISLLAGFVK